MISVYRIYIGRSWQVSDEAKRLYDLFDSLPDFLYSTCALPPDGPDVEADDPVSRRAATKIAMAQCHVALVWGGDDDPAPEWTEREIDVARLGFRRPIPIVAIVPAEGTASALVAREADRTVPMSATSIGLAIQELAAAASAAKRSAALERDEHDGTEASTVPAARSRAAALGSDRELPVTEIVLAYEQLRAGRNGRGTGAGSV